MKKYIQSNYIEANIATELNHMSKERLEDVVSQIARIAMNDSLSNNERLHQIRYLLSKRLNIH